MKKRLLSVGVPSVKAAQVAEHQRAARANVVSSVKVSGRFEFNRDSLPWRAPVIFVLGLVR